MKKVVDLTGKKFGRLVVLSRGQDRSFPCGTTQIYWNCRCKCGEFRTIGGSNLRSGGSKSCGCWNIENLLSRKGSKSPSWKGGKTNDGGGYVRFSYGPHKGKLEHRVVMAKHLGRELLPEETVHHRNGIRSDNRSENLELWSSDHRPGQRVSDLTEWAIQHLKTYAPEVLK